MNKEQRRLRKVIKRRKTNRNKKIFRKTESLKRHVEWNDFRRAIKQMRKDKKLNINQNEQVSNGEEKIQEQG